MCFLDSVTNGVCHNLYSVACHNSGMNDSGAWIREALKKLGQSLMLFVIPVDTLNSKVAVTA